MGKNSIKKKVILKQKLADDFANNPFKTVTTSVEATTIEVEASISSPDLLQRQLELEIPPRLAALQRQLEILDQEKYTISSSHYPINGGGRMNSPTSATAEIITNTSVNEVSLRALRKRLAEVRLQLYGNSNSDHHSSRERIPQFSFVDEDGNEIENFYDDDPCQNGGGSSLPDDSNSILLDEDFMEEFLLKESINEEINANNANNANISILPQPPSSSSSSSSEIIHNEAEVDNALSILNSCQLPIEEKISLIRQKFCQLLKHDASWRGEAAKAAQMINEMRRQRQLVSVELDKANAIRQKLELMCRDLHHENKKLKAELQAATTPHISPDISPITLNKMDENMLPKIPEHVEKEGIKRVTERLYNLSDLFNSREKHVEAVLTARMIESQFLHAKLAKANMTIASQTHKMESDQRRITQNQRTEATLRQQLREYIEKFRQVEETLAKSNDLFTTFRQEMEQMTLKLSKLERENNQLQNKCSTLSKNIIEMADERAKIQQALETIKVQKGKLEVLCRALQAERKQQQSKDKDNSDG